MAHRLGLRPENGKRAVVKPLVVVAVAAAIGLGASSTYADPLACSLTGYTVTPGLAAAVTGETLAVTWYGARSQELRLRFQVPFDATGKKWARIAVWDSAGNGAMVQPVKLSGMTTTTAAR